MVDLINIWSIHQREDSCLTWLYFINALTFPRIVWLFLLSKLFPSWDGALCRWHVPEIQPKATQMVATSPTGLLSLPVTMTPPHPDFQCSQEKDHLLCPIPQVCSRLLSHTGSVVNLLFQSCVFSELIVGSWLGSGLMVLAQWHHKRMCASVLATLIPAWHTD